MIKTVIFDFDGTIADSFKLVAEIAYELTGIPRKSDEEVMRLRKLPLLKAVREVHIPLAHIPRLLLQGRQKMHERIVEVKPFAGVPEVLQSLHEEGHHLLVMSSNSENNVRSFLRANKLESCFDGVYGGASIFSKAGGLRKILRRNRLDAKQCFYVGDEVRDIVGATRAGITPISVTWGYQAPEALEKYTPHALIHKPADLLKSLR
jgi:phosphoglycolate phosphatase